MQAIPRLKNRIAVLLSALTGAILLFACLLAYQISARQINDAHTALFDSLFSSLISQVQSRHAIDVVDIHHFEQQNGVIVRLYENGQAIVPAIPQGSDARQSVIALAQQQITGPGAFNDVTGGLTVNDPAQGTWHGEYQIIPVGSRTWYGILMLKAEDAKNAEIRNTGFLYMGIFFGALLCLVIISRVLAGVAAKPVQKAYQQQLEFTTAAGHDLRSPIAIIKSSAQIIQKDAALAQKNADKIVNESDRLAHLVDDLLLLSAGEANILQMDVGEVDVESVLISLYEQFTPLAAKQDVKLELQFPEGTLPKVKGDSARIHQILAGFLENALEYGKDGKQVELSAAVSKRHVTIRTADHGTGISDAEKALVFGQFYRADKSRSKKEHFGLGLSIAQKLAANQNATVSVEDTSGGGATFILRLRRV